MALFGKKEKDDKPPVGQPPIRRDMPKEPKKSPARETAPVVAKESTKDTTYLGKNLKITGHIFGEGSLIILGTFEGEFDIKGQLKIGQGASVKGNIKATSVSINGHIEGTILASERILLDSTAAMKGRLVTPKISIQDGAVFDGELQMSGKSNQAPKAPAPEPKVAPKEAPKTPPVSEIKPPVSEIK
jgi:cytoskeletal protein CcmA (bactofilin family)